MDTRTIIAMMTLDAALVALTVSIGGAVAGGTVMHVRQRRRTPSASAAREALERARLVEQLNQIVGDLTSRLDHREVLRRIAGSAVALVGADAGAYASRVAGRSTIVAAHGIPESVIGFEIGPDEGVISDVVASGRTVVIDDYHLHPHRVAGLLEAIAGLHTVVAVPSFLNGEVSGALFVLFRRPGRPVTPTELDVLTLLAGHAATALDNTAAFSAVLGREAHEQSVVEALADGVAVLDLDGIVTSWNSAAAAMTGVTSVDAVGHPPAVPVGPPGVAVEHELGDDRWIEAIATPLAPSGETVLALRDVSEQKAFERAQSLFLATTTHEIKTPLTIVSGFASTLQRRAGEISDDDRERALSAIVRRSEGLVRLIDRLLLGFRVQAGSIELDLRAVDVGSALDAAVATVNAVSDAHEISLDVPGDLPLVVADPHAVDDVVAQLLENAVKYSPDGGPIWVAARAGHGEVTVTVTDKGIGLDPDDAPRVFDRFYRGAEREGKRIGGVGLGLYIVRQLVEAQGGHVHASGAPGAGAMFEFTLPVAEPESVTLP
jgi:GAF domain-containing protein